MPPKNAETPKPKTATEIVESLQNGNEAKGTVQGATDLFRQIIAANKIKETHEIENPVTNVSGARPRINKKGRRPKITGINEADQG